jgi:hypothetical protein
MMENASRSNTGRLFFFENTSKLIGSVIVVSLGVWLVIRTLRTGDSPTMPFWMFLAGFLLFSFGPILLQHLLLMFVPFSEWPEKRLPKH